MTLGIPFSATKGFVALALGIHLVISGILLFFVWTDTLPLVVYQVIISVLLTIIGVLVVLFHLKSQKETYSRYMMVLGDQRDNSPFTDDELGETSPVNNGMTTRLDYTGVGMI